VDLDLGEVQAAVKQLYRRFFDDELGREDARSWERDNLPDGLHRRLAATGAFGIAIATELGGGGAGLTELCLVSEEAGAHLAPVMLVETAVVIRLLSRVNGQNILLQPVLDGTRRVGLAVRPVVNQVVPSVPYGCDIDAVVALQHEELLLCPVDKHNVQRVSTLAGASSVADCQIDHDRSVCVASGPTALRLYEMALDDWRVLTAATLVGIAQRCLDMATAYASQRHQFGRPIGSFQSIAHALADVAVAIDGARLLLYEASWSLDQDQGRAARLAPMAYCFAAETALESTYTCLHSYGGYGFMKEHDIQRYYRHAAFLSTIGGGRNSHLDVVADRILPVSVGRNGLLD
jgi:alkylation response protein AidB-like acyl-CoA dehydrogenase